MKSSKLISLNPGKNYAVIGEIEVSTPEEITQKVAKARAAQSSWADLGVKGRAQYLEKLYKELVNKKQEIRSIISQEMGMPISVANMLDVEIGLQFMRGYLDNAEKWLAPEITLENDKEIHYIFYEPKGVVGISVPWNYPFLIFIWSVMQNLIVGNTVVLKHSEQCPLTGKLLETIVNSVGLPDGVFNEVYGDGATVGEAVMNSAIDLIYFTGSVGVGKHLYQVAAQKFIPAVLELGGSAPGIVFEDADIQETVELIYLARYLNTGQSCDALKRLIVHANIFDKVVQQLKKTLSMRKVGYQEDQTTDLGPLVNERQLLAVEEQVADAVKKGAKIICGGKRPAHLQGAYYEPTILTNISFGMRVWKEEVFGPVLPVVPFKTEEEAIKLANDTLYGLGGYIYTKDMEQALRVGKQLKTGDIAVNSASYNIPQDPFGGYKNSGLGREHGRHGMQELCNVKIVALEK